MVKVSVMYPFQAGARFDHAYYRDTHMPLVKARMGDACLFYTVDKGICGGTPDDPPEFRAPPAPLWYRYVLQNPSATVVLMAPENRAELEEDLTALESRQLTPQEYEALAAHGQRVRRHAGRFP